MLGCHHVREHLSDVLDGELKGLYGLYVRFHSTICPPCRRVRRNLVQTVSLLHDLRDEATGPDQNQSEPPEPPPHTA